MSLQTSIGHQTILHDISLTVEGGDRLAIVGPSGAGKTHLLRLFNRLSEPTTGHIFYNGRDIRRIPVIDLRRRVALVLQESRLLGMTVADALRYPLQLQRMPSLEIKQRLDTWVERMRLPGEWLESTEKELSVGQRQWVAIARALIQHPDVLLLDEPTSALDLGRGEALMNLLQNLSHEGLTILLVTHQLELAAQGSNRVLYLKQGHVAWQSPTHQVDWVALRQDLVATEQQQADEWGE
ncbi:ATP-binding cassette domain-containing protein [Leptolyngbya sp. FACHB-8]|uniref:ABC transporter ATP-binding protein n=1 Tax=unclassified Leptolyngbya TaxID=2650499 RepID=UPI003220591D